LHRWRQPYIRKTSGQFDVFEVGEAQNAIAIPNAIDNCSPVATVRNAMERPELHGVWGECLSWSGILRERSGRNSYQATNNMTTSAKMATFRLFISCLLEPEYPALGCSISVVEYAPLVIGVVQLCAPGTDTTASLKENLSGSQHAQGWSNEIDPKRVPVASVKC
jgi:hypothetical protein